MMSDKYRLVTPATQTPFLRPVPLAPEDARCLGGLVSGRRYSLRPQPLAPEDVTRIGGLLSGRCQDVVKRWRWADSFRFIC